MSGDNGFFFPSFDRNTRAYRFSIDGKKVGSKVNQSPSNKVKSSVGRTKVGATRICRLNGMSSHFKGRGKVLATERSKLLKP